MIPQEPAGFGLYSLSEFLTQLASKSPTPGGGAVAAITLGHSAALACMVLQYALAKEAYARFQPRHLALARDLEKMYAAALELADADAREYSRLNAFFKMHKDDPRREGLAAAAAAAIAPPAAVMRHARTLLQALPSLVDSTPRTLASDLRISGILALAAFEAGAANVRANLSLVAPDERERWNRTLDADLLAASRERQRLDAALDAPAGSGA